MSYESKPRRSLPKETRNGMSSVCQVEGCNGSIHGNGFCKKHWSQWRLYGEIGERPRGKRPKYLCLVADCNRGAHGSGLCTLHYQRWKKTGSATGLRREIVKAAEAFGVLRQLMLVETDECLIWPLRREKNGYGRISNRFRAHREMCRLAHGEPSSELPHALHSCGNGHLGCVNKRHLRWGTPLENRKDALAHGVQPMPHDRPKKTRIFGNKVRRAALERAAGRCEASGPFYNRPFDDRCTIALVPKGYQFDHFFRWADGGESTLENCRVVCLACHDWKTRNIDTPWAAKSKRIGRQDGPVELRRKPRVTIRSRPSVWAKRKMQSRPFQRSKP